MTTTNASKLRDAIAQLERVHLGERDTPMEPMPRLSAALGGPPLYIKRDDLTGLAFGGNKTRMLEFSMADAQAKGADVVVTGMAVQSNYSRQTAAACANLGLELHLFLRPEREIDLQEIQGNHLLQRLFGAHVTLMPDNDRAAHQAAIEACATELAEAGRAVYIPRQPDTVDLDAIAYAEVALEIVEQCQALDIRLDYLYTAALDTTQAGLVLGLKCLDSNIQVRGYCPFNGLPERRQEMADIANQASQRLGLGITLSAADFHSDDSYVGERYGVPTQAGLEAIKLVAQTEGILLDPVYTGKAMSALIEQIENGMLPNDKPIVFLHTGGAPALFGYATDVLSVL